MKPRKLGKSITNLMDNLVEVFMDCEGLNQYEINGELEKEEINPDEIVNKLDLLIRKLKCRKCEEKPTGY